MKLIKTSIVVVVVMLLLAAAAFAQAALFSESTTIQYSVSAFILTLFIWDL